MIIKETIERECCDVRKDLKPIFNSPKIGRFPEVMFCIHCGSYFRYYTFTDAAGASDWDYRKLAIPLLTIPFAFENE
jgi:hypothetical protein